MHSVPERVSPRISLDAPKSLSRQSVEEQGMLTRKLVRNGIENITLCVETLRIEEHLFDT